MKKGNKKGKKKTIFVVEDDLDISELIELILKEEGFNVKVYTEIKNVEVDTEKCQPDLIMMDLWVHGFDGAVVTKNLKQKKETSHIPIILVSAKNSLDRIAKSSQADGFLSKPFSLTALIKIVHSFV